MQLGKATSIALEEEIIIIPEEELAEPAQEEIKVLTIAELYNKIALLEKEIQKLQKK